MSLVLSRSYPDDPIQQNREHFWGVTSEGVYIGSIVHQAWQQSAVWHWTIQVHAPAQTSGSKASLRRAMMR